MDSPFNLTNDQIEALIATLKDRFAKHVHRHQTVRWESVESKIIANPQKLWSLFHMEESGGEPDVVSFELQTDRILFCDCAPESPKGRRSLCYDQEALASRKEYKPKNSAVNMAAEIGIDLLTEAQYAALQQFGPIDTKTSSWLHTPPQIRELGGAIFGDYRFGRVFIYHNGAESYYGARGFRGLLQV